MIIYVLILDGLINQFRIAGAHRIYFGLFFVLDDKLHRGVSNNKVPHFNELVSHHLDISKGHIFELNPPDIIYSWVCLVPLSPLL